MMMWRFKIISDDEDRWLVLPSYYMHHIGRPAYSVLPVMLDTISKLQQPDTYTYNIVIYGDTLDSSMLAY